MVVGSLTTPQLLFRKEAGSSKQAVEITKTLIKKNNLIIVGGLNLIT